jgi:hypothetical protein
MCYLGCVQCGDERTKLSTKLDPSCSTRLFGGSLNLDSSADASHKDHDDVDDVKTAVMR